MYTLGINAVYHDSAACLVKDGQVIAAAEEERFTHIKHAKRPIPFSTYELPFHAIAYCLKEADINLVDVEHIAYSYDPFSLLGQYRDDATITLPLEPSAHPIPAEWESAWDPLFLSSIVNAPRHLVGGVPHHLQARFRGIRPVGPYRWHFVPHHLAHTASAFYPSPFDEAAVLTLDGRGEKATTNYAIGKENQLELLGQVNMPHSLGILYEQVTEYLGFLHSSDEYKVMALASFGKPHYVADFREIIQLEDDGQYTIQPPQLKERFGLPRLKGELLEQRHYDIAHSLQVVLEETVLAIAHWLHQTTGVDNLCMAGGVALNCVMNARLRDKGPFKHIWVQPAAGDAGTALGAALWIDAKESRRDDSCSRPYRMNHAFLGPNYSDEEIEEFLRWSKLPYRRLTNIAEEAADILTQDKVIGWFQGRMEFGPRALGGRSILASPINASMQVRLNEIKDREDFRPVAPVVLEEEAANWFANADVSPFMLFVYDVLPSKAEKIPAAARNVGWRAACGEIIAFTDDDCIPDRNWLKAGVSAFVDGVVGVQGRTIVPLPDVPTDYELNAAGLERGEFVTANCFYRREAIASIGGFDERFTAAWREDSDLFFTLLERDRQFVYAPDAIVVHPIRPAPWGVSLSQQRKSMFNALLYKKHPTLYRQKLQPVTPWHYYWIVTAIVVALWGELSGHQYFALAAFSVWIVMTGRFCMQRLHQTSHTAGHIAEIIFTSVLIPPLSIFWRIFGALKFRVFFL